MTDNPIIREEEMTPWRLSARRPVPKGDSSLVFVDGRGRIHAAKQAITVGETVWGNLRRLYEVDTAEHDASFSGQLPCREKGFSFDFTLHLSWQVHRPEQIVRDGRRDVRPLYERYLTDRCKQYSEEYGLEDREEIERKLRQELSEPMVLDGGITVRRCTISLSLGEEAERHLASLTRAVFDAREAELAHKARVQGTRYATAEQHVIHELDTLKGEQEGEHKVREAQQEAALAALQRQRERLDAEHQLDLARQREAHQQELRLARMRMYEEALASSSYGVIPLLLAQNPDDVREVLDLAIGQRASNFDGAAQLVKTLAEAQLIDGVDLDPAKQQALKTLLEGLGSEALDRALGGKAIPERAGSTGDTAEPDGGEAVPGDGRGTDASHAADDPVDTPVDADLLDDEDDVDDEDDDGPYEDGRYDD